jgi:signal transduction histidine kinase
MTKFWSFVDKFRPLIKDHNNTSLMFRSRMFIITNLFFISFTSFLFILEKLFHLNIRMEIIVFLFFKSVLLVILHKKLNAVGPLMLIKGLSFLSFSAYMIIQGGALINTLVYWFPLVPLVVTFISGRLYGAVSVLGVFVTVYIIYEKLHMNGLVLREGLTFERYAILQNIHLITLSCFIFLLAIFLITTHNALERNVERVKNKITENSKSFLISRMSAGISHEISNPLCAIRFANEVIKVCISKDEFDKEKLLNMAVRIDGSVDRAVVIVDALKVIGEEKLEQNFTYVSVEEIVSDIDKMYKPDMHLHKIKFIVRNDTLLNDKIFCFKEKVVEAIIHLMNNALFEARKFPEDEREITFAIDRSGAYFTFSIIDPGSGIDSSISPYMYDPFFTEKDIKVGTGLGLTLVSTIAKNHSGKITYGLTEGKTTFALSIGII